MQEKFLCVLRKMKNFRETVCLVENTRNEPQLIGSVGEAQNRGLKMAWKSHWLSSRPQAQFFPYTELLPGK